MICIRCNKRKVFKEDLCSVCHTMYCKVCGEIAVKRRLCEKHLAESIEQKQKNKNEYQKKYHQTHKRPHKQGVCSICGLEKILYVDGKCSKCYARTHRYCKCGLPIFRQGRCKQHYEEFKKEQIERRNKNRKAYYENNKDWINEKSKTHHRENADIYRKRARDWIDKNYERFEKNKAAYYERLRREKKDNAD